MFGGFATCKSVIRDSVELFRAKSRCEDTFFETENWQTLRCLTAKKKKKTHKNQKLINSSAAVVFTITLIMINKLLPA